MSLYYVKIHWQWGKFWFPLNFKLLFRKPAKFSHQQTSFRLCIGGHGGEIWGLYHIFETPVTSDSKLDVTSFFFHRGRMQISKRIFQIIFKIVQNSNFIVLDVQHPPPPPLIRKPSQMVTSLFLSYSEIRSNFFIRTILDTVRNQKSIDGELLMD